MSGMRKTGKECMEEQGEDPRLGKWTDKETAILLEVIEKRKIVRFLKMIAFFNLRTPPVVFLK